MTKNGNSKIPKKVMAWFLFLVLIYVVLMSFKSIYDNLQSNPAVQMGLYNPKMDLATTALITVFLGFLIGYRFKNKR
jgi:hypothetical protein